MLIDKKDTAAQLLAELRNLRTKKLELVHDKCLQIVVKRGLVEIPTSGFISDYDGAILVDRHEIENVNSIIQVSDYYESITSISGKNIVDSCVSKI